MQIGAGTSAPFATKEIISGDQPMSIQNEYSLDQHKASLEQQVAIADITFKLELSVFI